MNNRNKPEKKKKPKKALVVFLIIIIVMLVLSVSVLLVIKHYTGGMTHVVVDPSAVGADIEIKTTDNEYDIEEDNSKEKLDVVKNFMLFGLSGDTIESDANRSDTNIIVSINYTDKKVNVISILRDTKASIEGYESQKINAAYKLGGYELALKTFNQCFKLGITDFVTIDFAEMTALIDYIGGIDIGINEEEAQYISKYTETTVNAGLAHLNGTEALLYSGIRKLDSDYFRASRQQGVLQAALTKVRNMSKTQYPDVIKYFLNTVTTSFTLGQLMDFVEDGVMDFKTAFYTIPDEAYEIDLHKETDTNGGSVWVFDMDAAAERINNIIYHDWTK